MKVPMNARAKSSFTTINPQMMNDEYIVEVAIPAIVVNTNTQHHDRVNEVDLIERVNLASSEKDTNPQRGVSISSSLADRNQSGNSVDITEQSDTNDDDEYMPRVQCPTNVQTPDEDEDAAVFYETQIDESSLIAYAKLADDGVHSGHESANSLKQTNYGDDDPKCKHVEIEVPPNGNGCRTPTNSVVDESATGEDDKQLVSTEEKAEDTCVTEDMSNDRDFCKLMDEIMIDLQDCDAEEIIRIFVGSGIVEEGLLTGYVSAEQVIAQLRTYRFISRDNLHHLQNIIMRLDDSELYFRCIQYLKHNHDIVFFYQEQEQIPKGFGVVRCFIGCRDFTRLTREDIEITRFKVASMVFMPAQFFYIIGIEPGKRIVVSLMVLERYVDELHVMAKDGLPELNLIGIEAIQIHNRTYSTAGRAAIDVYWGNKTSGYTSVYRELREKCERVEEQDREIRDLHEELEFLQLEVDTVGAEIDVLTNERVDRFGQRRRSRSRSNEKRYRARSMPPRSITRGEGRQRFLAITSGTVKETNQSLVAKRMSGIDCQQHSMNHASNCVDEVMFGRAMRYLPTSPRTSTEHLTRQRFDDRDHLMHDIQAIIDEIALVQSSI